MITIRQLERLFAAKAWDRLLDQLLTMRPDDCPATRLRLRRPVPLAALAILRLDELNQPCADIIPRLIRQILAAQEPDGGWGDVLTTALCLHALFASRGQGPAIDAGLRWLANLQRSEGAWPAEPIRRMPADAFTTAFVLFHLSAYPGFAGVARPTEALAWLRAQEPAQDPETHRLHRAAALQLLPHPVAA